MAYFCLFAIFQNPSLNMSTYNPPKPGPQSRALCVCIVNSYGTLLNWPIDSLLFLFIFFSIFFVLIHDYTLCFTSSPYYIFSYCKFSYYNYISIWPYYIVIHFIWWCKLCVLNFINLHISPGTKLPSDRI